MKNLVLIFLAIACSASLSATRYFVVADAGAANAGTAWETATSLNNALTLAIAGDEIWVARGTYIPNYDNDRNFGFIVPSGVALFGGFQGTERSINERNAGANPTILSGNIGLPHSEDDDVYTVVTLQAGGAYASTLDGFTVRDGSGRSFTEGTRPRNVGGGLYLGGGTEVAHNIANCTFIDNEAHNGGAVFINGGNPIFTNCSFLDNKADFNGGAVYTQATAKRASPVFNNCTFRNNTSNSGAGITNNGTNGSATPLLISCRFIDNYSLLNGAAIYNLTGDAGEAEPILDNCEFIGNASVLNDDVSGTAIQPTLQRGNQQAQGGKLRPVSARKK